MLSLPSVSLSSPAVPLAAFFFLFPFDVAVVKAPALPAALELVGVAFPLPPAASPPPDLTNELDTGVGAELPGVEVPVSSGESYKNAVSMT